MRKKANTWLQRHNPGVLFDKDTWKGVGQYAKEQYNNLKQTGNQLKKDYWDNAAGNKNFWSALKNGPQTAADRYQFNADMGNAALNVPISAVANAIPSVYNTAASVVNPILSVGSKVLSLDATKKGPQLPRMDNWYKGRDFFQGGTPGMSQMQAALGGEATGIALGLRAPKGVNSIGTAIHNRGHIVPDMLWSINTNRAWKTGARSKFKDFLNNAYNRSQLVDKYNTGGANVRVPDYSSRTLAMKTSPYMDDGLIPQFDPVANSGVKSGDYEFRGIIRGAGPARDHVLPAPGYNPKTGDPNTVRASVMYKPEGADMQPVYKYPFITDNELRPKDNTLFKGYTSENLYSGRALENNVNGAGKLAGGDIMWSTRDPGLAEAYGEGGTLFSIDPYKVNASLNSSGTPFNYSHGNAARHLKFKETSKEVPADTRVPFSRNMDDMLFHPNATESLIQPTKGDTSYLIDYLAPTANGDFYHFVRKGQESRFNPTYISTENRKNIIDNLMFPGYVGGHSKLFPGERKILGFLRDNIGLGRTDYNPWDGNRYYPFPLKNEKRNMSERSFNRYYGKAYPKTGATASAYMVGSNVANANRQTVTE